MPCSHITRLMDSIPTGSLTDIQVEGVSMNTPMSQYKYTTTFGFAYLANKSKFIVMGDEYLGTNKLIPFDEFMKVYSDEIKKQQF